MKLSLESALNREIKDQKEGKVNKITELLLVVMMSRFSKIGASSACILSLEDVHKSSFESPIRIEIFPRFSTV